MNKNQLQSPKISAFLFITLTSVFSTSLLAADPDFLALGFAPVSLDEDEEDSDSSASAGAEVPLRALPSVKCQLVDFAVRACVPTQETIWVSCDGLNFSITKEMLASLKQEAQTLNITAIKHLKDNEPKHVGKLIKEVCKAKDSSFLSNRIKSQVQTFCGKNYQVKDRELELACSTIYDACLAKPQHQVACFTTNQVKFEAFFDDKQEHLIIRESTKFAEGAFKDIHKAVVIAFKDVSAFNGEQVSIKSRDSNNRENEILQELNNEYIMYPATKILAKMILDSRRDARSEYLCPRAEGEMGKIIFKTNENLKAGLAVKYALHVAKGLEYLHTSCNLVHRDFKHENVLIVSGIAKIADFGSVLQGENLDIPMPTGGISQASPEAMIKKSNGNVEHGFPMDMWAFGVCLFELMSPKHEKPYFCINMFGGSGSIKPDEHEKMLFTQWPQPKDESEKQYRELVVSLLKFNKLDRISAQQAVLFLNKISDLKPKNQ